MTVNQLNQVTKIENSLKRMKQDIKFLPKEDQKQWKKWVREKQAQLDLISGR